MKTFVIGLAGIACVFALASCAQSDQTRLGATDFAKVCTSNPPPPAPPVESPTPHPTTWVQLFEFMPKDVKHPFPQAATHCYEAKDEAGGRQHRFGLVLAPIPVDSRGQSYENYAAYEFSDTRRFVEFRANVGMLFVNTPTSGPCKAQGRGAGSFGVEVQLDGSNQWQVRGAWVNVRSPTETQLMRVQLGRNVKAIRLVSRVGYDGGRAGNDYDCDHHYWGEPYLVP